MATTFRPRNAPVTDALATHGVELTRSLLRILTASIFLLVVYLWWLDSKTSDKVDQLYANAFSAIEARGEAPWQLNALRDTFDALKRSPDKIFPKGAPERTQDNLRQIGEVLRLPESDIESLSACGALVKDAPAPLELGIAAPPPPVDAPPASAGSKPDPSITKPGQPAAPVVKTPPVRDEQADVPAKLDRCLKLLEEKSFASGGPLDTERVRLMRDFAKDMQENHQGLRTFWLAATQLILVNVLLPLLTALLGYIFGRQSASS